MPHLKGQGAARKTFIGGRPSNLLVASRSAQPPGADEAFGMDPSLRTFLILHFINILERPKTGIFSAYALNKILDLILHFWRRLFVSPKTGFPPCNDRLGDPQPVKPRPSKPLVRNPDRTLRGDVAARQSPVGIIPAFSTMRITVRSGARVRCRTPLGTTKPCRGASSTVRCSRSIKKRPWTT